MSATLTGPALNASNADPGFTVPSAPPPDASNHPDDNTAGTPGEMSATDRAAIDNARTGKDQQEPAAPEATTDEPKPATEAKPATEPKPDDTPPAIKREITIERNKRRDAENAAKSAEDARLAAEARLDSALKALELVNPKPADPNTADPRPMRDTFDTPDAYEEALIGWSGRKAAAEAKAATEAEFTKAKAKEAADATAAAQKAEADTLHAQWAERSAKAAEKYTDFEEVAGADVPVSDTMAGAILRADNGPDIAYHLGKNPAEAARIAALPTAGAQIFEMGKLAATLAQPTQVRVSQAPDPITPINGPRETVIDTGREETMDEVAARVAKRERNGRTPMWGRQA